MSGETTSANEAPTNDSGAQPADTESGSSLRRALEEANAAKSEALNELAELKRNTAFKDAGVPTDKWGAMFRKSYEGDLEAAAIQAAVAEMGLDASTQPQADATAPEAPTQEAAVNVERDVMNDMGTVRTAGNQGSDTQLEALVQQVESGEGSIRDIEKLAREMGILQQ